jgi:hypothetical protein
MIKNKIMFGVGKPCNDCYLLGMQADLVRKTATGAFESVNIDDGLWLHHMVMIASGKQDVTCAGKGLIGILGGQRFFSSGNERTPTVAGGAYGYPTGSEAWTLIADLMNMNSLPADVFIEVAYTHAPVSTPGLKPVTPVWLDINQCGTSEMPAKTGQYNYQYEWTSTKTGKLLGIGGHLHDGGTNLTIHKNGQLVCDSVATYGGRPEYIEGPGAGMPGMAHISEMKRCQGTAAAPVTSIVVGDKIRLTANYDTTKHMVHGDEPVMGIAIGYWDFG